MSPSRRTRPSLARSAVTVLVAAALALALSACGASLDAQTYRERNNADAENASAGTLALRGLAIQAPKGGDRTLEKGADAEVPLFVANSGSEPDELVEVTTDAAESVEVLVDDEPTSLQVPARGSTQDGQLRLVGLTDDLMEGEYVTLTFRFERNGTIEMPVPVATSGRTDRPVYTGDGHHEPALQAPAGGHGEPAHDAKDGKPVEGEGEEGAPTGGTSSGSTGESSQPADDGH